ncbi:MAG: hypothetical protein JW958_12550 [Candidatus Eisenbacteria bacterium]|nr:hypothetical protein [Candidatus Eisenbacteria bacterium]
MARRLGFALMLLIAPTLVFAGGRMSVDDVIRLLEAGVGERVVIAQIEESGSEFDLSTEDILDLEEMGVPEKVMEAMIRSASGETEYVEEEEVEEYSAVPSHLGYYRYQSPNQVVVRLVPWSVPAVTYVDLDPWWWDPWWWETPYYVSYVHYPWYRSSWYFRSSWYRPVYWPVYHYNHWYDHDHYVVNRDHGRTYHTAAAAQSSWKRKTQVERNASVVRTGSYSTREKTVRAKALSGTSQSRYRAATGTRGKSAVSPTVRSTDRYRATERKKSPTAVSTPQVRSRSSGSKSPSPTVNRSRSTGASRTKEPASPSRSSGSSRSGSSGGKKKSR